MKKLVLGLMLLGLSFGAGAACSTKSLSGSYGFGAVSSSSNGNCASIGTIMFTGKGTAAISIESGCGGEVGINQLSGTYEVGVYCVGEVDAEDGTKAYFVFDKALKAGQIFVSQNKSIAFGTIFKQ